jgi:hypothetical protein
MLAWNRMIWFQGCEGGKGAVTIVHNDVRRCAKMRYHLRKNLWHDSWICEVGLDIEVPVTYRPVFDTTSCRCDLVAGAGELIGDEGAGARTDAQDEDGGLGRHVEITDLGISIEGENREGVLSDS